jgi:hypothetical protein
MFKAAGLDRVIVAIIESIIHDRWRGVGGDGPPVRDAVIRFVLDQGGRMPDYLCYPFKCLVLVFGAWPLLLKGRLFHKLSPEDRAQQVRSWRNSKLNFRRDFIKFYETFVIFAWYSERYPNDHKR